MGKDGMKFDMTKKKNLECLGGFMAQPHIMLVMYTQYEEAFKFIEKTLPKLCLSSEGKNFKQFYINKTETFTAFYVGIYFRENSPRHIIDYAKRPDSVSVRVSINAQTIVEVTILKTDEGLTPECNIKIGFK
jgi:hypothetical protein